jgi:hypothetical protein
MRKKILLFLSEILLSQELAEEILIHKAPPPDKGLAEIPPNYLIEVPAVRFP